MNDLYLTPNLLLDYYKAYARGVDKNGKSYLKGPDRSYVMRMLYQDVVLTTSFYNRIVNGNYGYTQPPPTEAERVFRGVLYSQMDSVEPFDRTEMRLKTFINLDIRKLLGISFLEYMNLSKYHMDAIDKVCYEWQNKIHATEKKEEAKLEKQQMELQNV